MIKSVHRNQGGIAHMMLFLVVLVIAGVGAAGYYVYNNQKDTTKNATSSAEQKVAEAECKRTIEDKDLCKMASNSDFDKENYVMTITGTQDGQQFTWSIQNDGENSHSNMLGFESITYDGNTYMKDDSGAWVKYPKSESTEEDDSFTDSLDFSDEEASWYTKIGKEPCGDKTCFHYSYKDPNDATNNAEFWFDDEDYKIRKITSTSAEGGSMEMLITYGNAEVSPPETYTTSE
jgi:outer membrane lipoprotein-sorting protein